MANNKAFGLGQGKAAAPKKISSTKAVAKAATPKKKSTHQLINEHKKDIQDLQRQARGK